MIRSPNRYVRIFLSAPSSCPVLVPRPQSRSCVLHSTLRSDHPQTSPSKPYLMSIWHHPTEKSVRLFSPGVTGLLILFHFLALSYAFLSERAAVESATDGNLYVYIYILIEINIERREQKQVLLNVAYVHLTLSLSFPVSASSPPPVVLPIRRAPV